jgi:hypothetical protein
MQLSDCENTDSFWEEADGRQLDCQLKMLKRLMEGLQAEVHALRLEKEQDYGRFSGDIADHGQRIKSLEGKRDSGEELQDKARNLKEENMWGIVILARFYEQIFICRRQANMQIAWQDECHFFQCLLLELPVLSDIKLRGISFNIYLPPLSIRQHISNLMPVARGNSSF